MGPLVDQKVNQAMTMEQTLNAINNSTILDQFADPQPLNSKEQKVFDNSMPSKFEACESFEREVTHQYVPNKDSDSPRLTSRRNNLLKLASSPAHLKPPLQQSYQVQQHQTLLTAQQTIDDADTRSVGATQTRAGQKDRIDLELCKAELNDEKLKRQKLSKLYGEQTAKNEQLRDDLEALQDQQRALINLLQQKDNSLAKHSKFDEKVANDRRAVQK